MPVSVGWSIALCAVIAVALAALWWLDVRWKRRLSAQAEAHAATLATQEARASDVAEVLGGASFEWQANGDVLLAAGFGALLDIPETTALRSGAALLARLQHGEQFISLGDYLRPREPAVDHFVRELRLRTASGEWRNLEARGLVRRGKNGALESMTVALLDMRAVRAREAGLLAANELLREALETLDSGLLCLDAEDRVLLCNARYRALYGFRDDEVLVGLPFRELVRRGFSRYPGELGSRTLEEAVDERMRVHRQEFGAREVELTLNRLWVLANDRLTPGGGLVCLRTDITRLKAAEASFKDRSELLEMAMRGSEAGIWHWDKATRQMVLSQRCRELLGLPLSAPAPSPEMLVQGYCHPDDRAALQRLMRLEAGVVAGDTWGIELRLRHGDGTWRWYSLRAAAKRGADGKPVRAAGSLADIHARKAHELELARARQQLSDAIESLDAGLVMYDAEGRFVLSNARFRDFFDCDGARLVPGERVETTLRAHYAGHPERLQGRSVDAAVADWLAVLHAGHGWRQVAFCGRWFQFDEFPTAEGGVVSLRTDITSLREAEAAQRQLQGQLQQAQKMESLGQLTGGVAHDFNNILASVLGYTALALGRNAVVKDPKFEEYLSAVRVAGERARDLVGKMLAFSRNRPQEQAAATRPGVLAEEAVSMLRSIIPANITLLLECEPDLPAVQIGAVELHQVLVNLAVNARDAIEGHGEIRITVRHARELEGVCSSCHASFSGQWVEITVNDSGAGIPPEHLARVFEPFFSTKEVGKGTGMGLAVSHGIVHAAGGHLLVEPRAEGGTRIRLLLAESTASPTVAGALPLTAGGAGNAARGQTVAVVDDEATVAHLWEEVLRDHGFRVRAFSDPKAFIDWVQGPDSSVDLLLTDQSMPGMSGVELTQQLHALRGAVPVILCSGSDSRLDQGAAEAVGIRYFHRKPVPIDAMLALVESALADA